MRKAWTILVAALLSFSPMALAQDLLVDSVDHVPIHTTLQDDVVADFKVYESDISVILASLENASTENVHSTPTTGDVQEDHAAHSGCDPGLRIKGVYSVYCPFITFTKELWSVVETVHVSPRYYQLE